MGTVISLVCCQIALSLGWQPVQGLPQPPDGQSQLDEPPLREVHQAQRRQVAGPLRPETG